jgi:hypothetical protein
MVAVVLQDFVNLTGKFNSIVVNTMKPLLCFFPDVLPLKHYKKNISSNTAYLYLSFESNFDLC